jgi:protein-disulfide isomerase
MRRLAAAALLLAAVAAAGPSPAAAQPAPGSAPTGSVDRAEVERIVREYLLANPEIVMEAVQVLRERQARAEEEAARTAIASSRPALVSDPRDPVGGNPRGDVTVVEFFDYQCGYCKQVHPTVRALLEADTGVRKVYKEFPILGPASVTAARAALAAKAQGRYEEMHAALMEARGQLDDDRVLRIARSVGLDVERLRADMASPAVERHIQETMALAAAIGIRGTPAFVIGDQLVPGATDLATLQRLVREARGG